jgi:Cu(I)/Ag(I) efflux system membrane fusion protein
MERIKKQGLPVVLLLMTGFLLGRLIGGEKAPGLPQGEEMRFASVESDGKYVYVCPMSCVPPRDAPGNCPVCGMQLVPVPEAQKSESGRPRIKLTPLEIASAGIELAYVQRKELATEVKLFGRIDYDPAHMSYVSAFMPCVIDRVYVKRAGQFVRWGDPLFDIYSSDLLETQIQLQEAMKVVPGFLAFQEGQAYAVQDAPVQERTRQQSGKNALEVEAALKKIEGVRQKLKILGLPKRDIDEFMKSPQPTGIATVYAPLYGQVIEQNAFEGQFINRGTRVFAIGDPTYVWARLDAYEADFPWLRNGQEVEIETEAYPGEKFSGKLVYISPVFNPARRTFEAGAILPEAAGRLKAGMLIRAKVKASLAGKELPLVIPSTAPLITGKRALVYVAVQDQEGVFEGREVTLGPKGKDYFVVKEGLTEGEAVAANGAFKIDSAVQILAKGGMMEFKGAVPAASFQRHGGSQALKEEYESDRMKTRGDNEGRRPETRRRPGAYGGSVGFPPPRQ